MILLRSKKEFEEKLIKLGYSKRKFAVKVNISETALLQIINGKQFPRPQTAKKICEGLDVNFDDVFTINEIKSQLS
ncbi:helix-turn-helix transcriptional regulator [Virgibacillus sp. DJP39]|uniref:helix-turn-helix transcriptional regulator n=1 Tax=Virgibacillus sp. DJP39 TaxID=3409790 RepID=UPI003BB7C784